MLEFELNPCNNCRNNSKDDCTCNKKEAYDSMLTKIDEYEVLKQLYTESKPTAVSKTIGDLICFDLSCPQCNLGFGIYVPKGRGITGLLKKSNFCPGCGKHLDWSDYI